MIDKSAQVLVCLSANIDISAFAEYSLGRMNKSVDGKDTAIVVFAVAFFVEIVKVADMEDKGVADGGPVVCADVVPAARGGGCWYGRL